MKKSKTHIAIVLDRSGSMYDIAAEVIAVCNAQVETIRQEAVDHPTTVTFITFANHPRLEYFNADPATLKPLGPRDYRPDGQTALFGGLGLAIKQFESIDNGDDSFLVMAVGEQGEALLGAF